MVESQTYQPKVWGSIPIGAELLELRRGSKYTYAGLYAGALAASRPSTSSVVPPLCSELIHKKTPAINEASNP